jgi:hypothetical protein
MTKQKCFLTKECLLFDLKTFHQNAAKAAETYIHSAGVFPREDKKILLEIAQDKKRHSRVIKSLTRLVEKHYR